MCGPAINQEEGRNVRRTLIAVGLVTAVALGFASPARAALLTITDTSGGSNTVWTLDVVGGCTTCTVTLTGNFQDPAGAANNYYTGTFIDAVQWAITGTTVSSVSSTVTSNATDATTTTWTAVEGSLNANQCGGGGNDAVCAESNDLLGFGPIATGSTLTWQFSVTFASALPNDLTGVTGNIRASFNTANSDPLNPTVFTNFSPGCPGTNGIGENGALCGSFAGSGGAAPQPLVPEPTSLLLFGTGLSMAAYRARRKKTQKKE
jgi:hypothetical protein